MTIKDLCENIDPIGLMVVFYDANDLADDSEPVWSGNLFDVPYWLLEMKLKKVLEDRYSISFREDFSGILGEKYKNKPGIIVAIEL